MSEHTKQCATCGYIRRIPGNTHIKCVFDWANSGLEMPAGDEHGVRSGWYAFPVNYDPAWMIESCPAQSTEVDPGMVRKDDPLSDALAILASVGRL